VILITSICEKQTTNQESMPIYVEFSKKKKKKNENSSYLS